MRVSARMRTKWNIYIIFVHYTYFLKINTVWYFYNKHMFCCFISHCALWSVSVETRGGQAGLGWPSGPALALSGSQSTWGQRGVTWPGSVSSRVPVPQWASQLSLTTQAWLFLIVYLIKVRTELSPDIGRITFTMAIPLPQRLLFFASFIGVYDKVKKDKIRKI